MELHYERKTAWEQMTAKELKELEACANDYMAFLDKSKTERESTTEIIRQAKENAFKSLEEVIKKGTFKKGDKIYLDYKGKSAVLMVVGEEFETGLDIVGSHIDVPRLDLKQVPLYEDGGLALLKTHYYGGVKKYQWANIPLALHGVIYKKDGEKVDVSIGEGEDEPVLYINDLLIHLSKDQLQKKMFEGITGEQLNVVIGSQKPANSSKDSKHPVKDNILKILNKKYGIIEEDFRVAELEVVPAGKARHVGLDSSMIAGHGHDDRVCAYASLRAILEVKNPKRTKVALFVDKEEVGSQGNTGMHGSFFENMLAELFNLVSKHPELSVRRAMANARVLSADVTAAFDPSFPDVFEKQNSAFAGCGLAIAKYTGSGGKGGCNDANAEFLQEVRATFDADKVVWQTGELGKVDAGGGGTIAYILANKGAEVVDCGVPVLSMHAPIELISKADLYMAYKGYLSFLK
ncbi:MAG: aminopeptidase [Tissierellia bacterium]|nr:aminopeptidase [Tissierellia bacterium]